MPPVLELDNARISYFTRAGEINVVPGISFKLEQGEALGLVGESGCGKSTVGKLLLRLIEPSEGTIRLDGQDITHLDGGAMRQLLQAADKRLAQQTE